MEVNDPTELQIILVRSCELFSKFLEDFGIKAECVVKTRGIEKQELVSVDEALIRGSSVGVYSC